MPLAGCFVMEITFKFKRGGRENDRLSLNRADDGVEIKFNNKVIFVVSPESAGEFVRAIEFLSNIAVNDNDKNIGQ